MTTGSPAVLLLALPWNRADYPSVQVGLLKASLRRRGFRVSAAYPYLQLASILGDDLYQRVADLLHPLLTEGFFAEALEMRVNSLLSEEILKTGELDGAQIETIRQVIPEFLDLVFGMIPWQDFQVVGFSCSFNQVFASLALAQRVKKAYPAIRIVMGGGNLSGPAGKRVLSNYRFIDCVISGPGEEALSEYLLSGHAGEQRYLVGTAVRPEEVCVPDYDEFFAHAGDPGNLCLIACASYGCSYGLCAFCSQNTVSGYHPVSAGKIVESVTELSRRYPAAMIEFADTSFPNSILDQKTVARFAASGKRFFAEMLPSLDDSKARALSEAGFTTIQLGIESFSTSVLRRMRKPTDLVTNVYNLRLAYEYEINVSYNLILDFPPLNESECRALMQVMPTIFHLSPPTSLVQFVLQGGSEVQVNPERFGITRFEPHRFYRAVTERYFSDQGLLPAYFQYANPNPESAPFKAIDKICRAWEETFDPVDSSLCYQAGETLDIFDRRGGVIQIDHLNVRESLLLRHLFDPKNIEAGSGVLIGGKCFDKEFDSLLEKRLILYDSSKAVSLPVSRKHRSLDKVFVNSAFSQAS